LVDIPRPDGQPVAPFGVTEAGDELSDVEGEAEAAVRRVLEVGEDRDEVETAEAVAVHQAERFETAAVLIAVPEQSSIEEELDIADARILHLHAGIERVAADDAPPARSRAVRIGVEAVVYREVAMAA